MAKFTDYGDAAERVAFFNNKGMKTAPARRFIRFDCIEFAGWADSMEKRNFALPSRAAKAPTG
ncbi:hypothetical protein [Lacipirellula parvula]|uniref:Uncharacterized protein n=1 Tax=Lacipirellula parvula TaxID=2650471 RepID=A0A5K7XEN7_9BACT|nr:hypothetical protein [Lacipirellula parvula]BBO34855.1 hypothetical protein PLANPX_4467 [Lacipirellula parvula]